MKISDRKINVKNIDDIFTYFAEYHNFKVVCGLTHSESRQSYQRCRTESLDNVLFFPETLLEHEIEVEGIALNCFENYQVKILLTFGQDKKAWEAMDKSLNKIIRSCNVVFVNSDAYSLLDGEVQMYNPTIIESDCKATQIGLSANIV
jgi:hypothetical protein